MNNFLSYGKGSTISYKIKKGIINNIIMIPTIRGDAGCKACTLHPAEL